MNEHDLQFTRRGFLKGSLGAASAALLGAATNPLLFPAPARAGGAAAAQTYAPSYFSAEEWAFLVAAADRLIPADQEGPGAVELGVPEFIDRQMDTDYGHGARWYLQGPFHPDADFSLGYQMRYAPRDMYRVAIAGIDGWCRQHHGKPFAELDAAVQDQVLALLEQGQLALADMNTREFFLQLLANTKEGYFADPMYGGNRGMGAWKMIGFPGARADFKDWVGQYGKAYPLGPVSILGEKG